MAKRTTRDVDAARAGQEQELHFPEKHIICAPLVLRALLNRAHDS